MKTEQLFRMAIEKIGINHSSSKRFLQFVVDSRILSPSEIYVLKCLVRDKFINQLLLLHNVEPEVVAFCKEVADYTGFKEEQIRRVVLPFWKGCVMSFWGVNTTQNANETIMNEYRIHVERWNRRLRDFNEGIIRVKAKGLYGWYTFSGKEIIPCKYSGATPFSEGMACVCDSNFFGFINILGNIEIDLTNVGRYGAPISSIGPFCDGIAICNVLGNRVGFLNARGVCSTFDFEYEYQVTMGQNPFIVKKNGLYGFMDYDLNVVLSPCLTEAKQFEKNNAYTCAVVEGDKWAIVDRKGNVVKSKDRLKALKRLSDSLFVGVVCWDKCQYRFYDECFNLKSIINQRVIDIVNYWERQGEPLLLIQTRSGVFYYMDDKGAIINKIGYDFAHPYINNFAWARNGARWQRLDRCGNIEYYWDDIDVLTPEVNGKVLIRNLESKWISIFDCVKRRVLFVIPNSEMSSPQIIENNTFAKCNCMYEIFVEETEFYYWANGDLFSSIRPLGRVFCKIDGCAHFGCEMSKTACMREVIIDGESVGVLNVSAPTDKITCASKRGDEWFFIVKTERCSSYILSKSVKSSEYSSIDGRTFMQGKRFFVVVRDDVQIVLNLRLEELFRADKETHYIVMGDVFVVKRKGKCGFINANGEMTLEIGFEWIMPSRFF